MSKHKPAMYYDPRMGDEGSDGDTSQPASPQLTRKHVHMDRHPTFEEGAPRRYLDSSIMSDETAKKGEQGEQEKPPRLTFAQWILNRLPVDLTWIPANWSWSKIKPVIRCAFVGWISVFFIIVPKLEVLLGPVCPSGLICSWSEIGIVHGC